MKKRSVLRMINRRQFVVTAATRTAGATLGATAACGPAGVMAADTAAVSGKKVFRAGAAAVDITPSLDVSIGGLVQVLPPAKKVLLPLHARAIVLDDGATRLALVACELCLLDTETAERTKALIEKRLGLPEDQVMISVAHTHMAPRVAEFGFGPELDRYRDQLPRKIAEAVEQAIGRLRPATIAWGVVKKPEYVMTRRWRLEPPRTALNPFGGQDRVVMRSVTRGNQPAAMEPSGTADTDLSFIALRHADGRPLALWANYSAHFGHIVRDVISADYFGHFSKTITDQWSVATSRPVAVMTNGSCGDTGHLAANEEGAYRAAEDMADSVLAAEKKLTFHDWVPLAAKLKEVKCGVRCPDSERLRWANDVLAGRWKGPKHRHSELYAKQALVLAKLPQHLGVKVHVVRIGEVALAATPCEIFGATGLAIKRESPTRQTVVVSLANGWTGYLVPPDQFPLGGYTTWPHLGNRLDANAEPKIRTELLKLLQRVSER